jgi:anion-transporting  ArsA/GET3 family ATPase
MTDILTRSAVIICLGPGGVGKTTTSAVLGLAAARAGRRVVVLTIDPARRLADAIGLEAGLSNKPRLIEGPWEGELWASMLDPGETFEALIAEEARTANQATRITQNRLFQNLTSSLAGTNEYMASERLRALHLDPRFDLVVVDTPPSRHAVDFLDSPARLVRFVDHRLYRSLLAPRRGLLRAINAAGQVAVRTIGRVVGTDLLEDVIDFFAAFEGLDKGFRQRADEVRALLGSDETSYVLVSSARSDPIDAVRWIADALNERGLSMGLLVANRLTPQSFAGPHRLSPEATSALDLNLMQLSELARSEAALIEALGAELGVETQILDDQALPVSDLEAITDLARQFEEQSAASA